MNAINTTSTLSLTEQNNAIITEAVNAVLSEAIEHSIKDVQSVLLTMSDISLRSQKQKLFCLICFTLNG